MEKRKLTFIEKLSAYHLMTNFIVFWTLILINIVAFIIYAAFPAINQNEVWSNVFIAIFTGLFATIIGNGAEMYIAYRNEERGEFLEDIYSFGIEALSQRKDIVLQDALKKCKNTIWISGYRLILTDRLKGDFAAAVKKGADTDVVVCPPWMQAFVLTYGNDETVLDNYFRVFHALFEASKIKKTKVQVVFSEKPLFSDTYKIDSKIITGPYLHNRDDEFNRIMAKDFFTYVVGPEKPLFSLMEDEFLTLREEAVEVIDHMKFEEIYKQYETEGSRMSEQEKIALLRKAVVKK